MDVHFDCTNHRRTEEGYSSVPGISSETQSEAGVEFWPEEHKGLCHRRELQMAVSGQFAWLPLNPDVDGAVH